MRNGKVYDRKLTKDITDIILKAAKKAKRETSSEPEPELTKPLKWPIKCLVGPGLEGAISCETKIGYVNGAKGWLIYRGYDIFDLCAYSTFEEVSYLLLHGDLPSRAQLEAFNNKLIQYRHPLETKRMLMSFPIEDMSAMAGLRLGVNLMRLECTVADEEAYKTEHSRVISSDEDSIPMETKPRGEEKAIYEFIEKRKKKKERTAEAARKLPTGIESSYHLISGTASIAAAVARIKQGHLPIEADPKLSHAANFLYMMTGRKPTPQEERVMDIALILHADHGMNASTFAAMVVASTLSDMYLSVGSGIAALTGPLHGGANEEVLYMLKHIGSPENVKPWLAHKIAAKEKIMGFGHRVYKAYDPRARVLGPLSEYLVNTGTDKEAKVLFHTAKTLEKEVLASFGEEKKIFPNVDFYSGIAYSSLGIKPELFTPIFAVSRVAGWTARVQEYLQHNRIFRPRSMYTGRFDLKYVPMEKRGK